VKIQASTGFCALLSILACGLTPAAFSEEIAPQAARVLSEYVYLHITRNQAISTPRGTRATSCRGVSGGIQA